MKKIKWLFVCMALIINAMQAQNIVSKPNGNNQLNQNEIGFLNYHETKKSSLSAAESENFGTPPNANWYSSFGGSGEDYARTIDSDSDGNIFIAGQFTGTTSFGDKSLNSIGNKDGFVSMFNSSHDIIWLSQIATTEGGEAIVYSMSVDQENVYVVGGYTGSVTIGEQVLDGSSLSSMFFAKFDKMGAVIFAKSIQGDGDRTGKKIIMDNTGSLYVLVNKSKSNSSQDPTLIYKYDNDGSLIWEKEPINTDYITINDMAISGNEIFWTGFVAGYYGGEPIQVYLDADVYLNTPMGRSQDIFVAKSDLNGDFAWASIAEHGTEINGYTMDAFVAADSSGNAFVTGKFRSNVYFGEFNLYGYTEGFVTKVNNNGAFQWATKLGYSGRNPIADKNGDCYVIINTALAKISTTGDILFDILAPNDINTFALNVTPNGEILQAGNKGGLIAFSKMSQSAVLDWDITFNGNSGSGYTLGMVVDADANSYLYGRAANNVMFNNVEISNSLFIAKYNKTGTVEWLNQLEGVSMNGHIGNLIYMDTTNLFIYIAFSINEDFVLPNNELVQVTEQSSLLILKYDFNGNFVSNILVEDMIKYPSLVTDGDGNLIVTGTFSNSISIEGNVLNSLGSNDAFIAKYNTSGELVWVKQLGGEDTEYNAIASCYKSDIYLTGEFYSRNIIVGETNKTYEVGDGHILFAKLNSDGEVLSAKMLASGEYEWNCWPTGITTDVFGNVFIKGWHGDSVRFDNELIVSPYSDFSYFIAKLDGESNVTWVKSIWEHKYGFDYNQFSTDLDGNVYLGAQALDSVHFEHDFAFKPENNYDLFLAKYDAAGTLNWVQTIQGVNSCSITGVVAHSNTNVFVSGYFSTNITLGPVNLNASNTHGFMVMLGDDIVNVNEVYNSNSKDKLIVGPIPSSGVVNFELGNNQFGVIEIYNLKGQMVQTIECFENGASVDLNHLMKGVYVAKRNSSSGVLTAKFILE